MNSNHIPSPKQIASAYIRMLDSEPAQKIAQACLDSSSSVTFDDLKRYAHGHPKIEEIERYYWECLSEQKTKEELLSDWNNCLSIRKIETLNAFIAKWHKCPLTEAHRIFESVGNLLDELCEEYHIEKEWQEACSKHDTYIYSKFLTNYPNSKYKDEAEKRIMSLKDDLLLDMKSNPERYCREEMYWYISKGVLTYDDLVVKSKVLDDTAYKHIKIYPSLLDEIGRLPYSPIEVEMPKSNNTDVYSFGTCGSGGKTSLLAAIMTLFDNKNFVLHESYGAGYARYLSDCMFRNALPPATDQYYIQVINTSLQSENAWHGVSFIEFSGEKAQDIAEDDDPMFVSCNIGPNLMKLMNNTNKKILLFAIDPSSTKKMFSRSGFFLGLFQSDVAELWAIRLKKDKEFCKKIVAIKIVVTKKDIWNIHSSQQAINTIIENGYKVFYDTIVDICHEHKIMEYNNFMPEVIPFSIGKFMPGDLYNFDDSDAKILLDSIRRDLDNNHKKKGFVNKIRKILKY